MLNPALAEMAAHDRIGELRRAGAKRSSGAESRVTTGATRSRPARVVDSATRIGFTPGKPSAGRWSALACASRCRGRAAGQPDDGQQAPPA